MPSLRTLQRRMLGYLHQIFRGPPDQPVVRQAFPRLYDSQLEVRRVLNADVPGTASDLLALVLNAGDQAGDGHADRFEVSQSQRHGRQEIAVSINDQQVWRGTADQLQSLRLQGSSDSDLFIIDPTLQLAGVISIDGGVNRPESAPDVVMVQANACPLHSVTVQDQAGFVQLQFALYESNDSRANAEQATLWQVSHVAQIRDYSSAAVRDIQITHAPSWTFSSQLDAHNQTLLRLTSAESSYEFTAPTQRLVIDTQSVGNSQQSLWLRDLDLSSIGQVRFEGDQLDTIVQQGWLSSSQQLIMATGSVELRGSIGSFADSHLTVQASHILQSGLMQLGPGSSVLLDSGAAGRTIIDGQLMILGDQQHLGGSITITGDSVQLGASALIDVSGPQGAGQVLIGGDQAGANPLVRNASHTTIAGNARIKADATTAGNGGRIIIYSTDRTVIENASNLSASGGARFGVGGFIETSGRRHLTLHGSPDVSAASGRAGQWLIDPEAISIVAVLPAILDPNISYVLVSDLLTLLNAGGDVILQTTTANPTLGDIVIEDPIVAAPGVSANLILQAARDIVFNNTFVGNANLGLQLQATRDVDASTATLTSMNYLQIQSGGDVRLQNVSVGSGSLNGGTALDIDAASAIELAGDLTTVGGHITLSAAQLQVEGSAARTIASGGTGITANTAGNINLNGLTAIDGTGAPADLTIDARGVLNGGTVRMASVINTLAGIRNLTVDTRGATTTGQLILDNGLASSTSILVSGNLSFTNTNVQLADNVILTTTQDTSLLALGTVNTDGSARNLQLISDANITTGSVNLTGGGLIARVDVDNDGLAALTSTATISAGSMQFFGSAAQNDSLSLAGNLTSTVGGIVLNGFNLAQLSGDSISQVNYTATNITTLALGSNVDITANGVINLDSNVTGILLSGASGSRNILDASGTNAAVNLTAVTSTNNNVDLDIRSDRNVNLKSIVLTGQVGVLFSRNNPADDSTANFATAITVDGLSVVGAARTNDSIAFNAAVNLGATGLNISQVTNTLFLGAVTTTTGDIDIASADITALSANLTTAGGNITIAGARLLVDGSAPRTINSGGNGVTANTAGNINLSGLTEIDGAVTAADLTIDSRGILNGGTVRLASVTNTLSGIRNLTVDTRGSTTTGQLILNNGLASSTSIDVSGNLNFANANTQLADNVNLTTRGNTSTLTLGSVSTDGSARTLQLTSDADITSGNINLTGGTLSAQVDANNDGVATFTSTGAITAGTLQVNGSAANNDSLLAQNNLTSTIGGIALSNFNRVQLSGDSTSQVDFTATNVTSVELNTNADITAGGAINLDSTVSGILLSGTSGSQNILDSSGTNAAINLAAVTSTNSNVDLAIRSDRSVSLKGINLSGAQVDVLFSRNNAANNSTANFTAAIISDGLSVTGANRTNDTVVINAPLTLASAGLTVAQVANTQVNSAVTSTTGNISITSTSTNLAANLTTTGGSIIFVGGTVLANNIVLTTQGNSGQITLGNVTTDGSARNLQLTSDANITTGSVNLTGGSFTAQVDANNDGVAAFTSTGAIAASSLQFSGSAAKNDTLSAQGNLTSTTGGIAFNNFDRVQLSGDSLSQTDFTATNINTFQLNSSADITASGPINLDSTVGGILLGGSSGSQNILDSNGTNAAIILAAVTSTNNNVDLALRSDRSLTLKSITLNGAQVDVLFSRNNPANNSTANFTATVNSDGLSVTGAARTNDSVIFNSPLTLGGAGLNVSQVASTQVVASVTTTTGVIAIASANSISLASNLITAGGNITLSGPQLLVDGTAARSIISGGSGVTASNAGNIDLSGLTIIDGVGTPADLTIDARGILNGGTVRLGSITNTLTGIRNLTVDTRGGTNNGLLILDNGIAASTSINVGGNLNFTNAITQLADNVILITRENTSSLTLGNVTTDGSARNLQLTSDANITTGSVNLTGGSFTAQVDANNDGVAAFTSTGAIAASSLQFSGSAAKNDTLSAQGNLTSTTGGIAFNNFDRVQLSGDSLSQTDFTATNINTFQLNSSADITASGPINLDSTVGGILLGGSSGSQNILDSNGTNAAIILAAVTSTNNNVDLALRSDRSLTLKSITLNGAQVDVLFSRNNPANNSTANFTATVNSDGLSVTGATRTNDSVIFNSPLTLGGAGLNVSQVGTVQLNGDVNASGHIAITQVSNRIQLVQNGRIVGTGNIDLHTGVNLLELPGAAATLNEIVSSTESGTVSLANTTATSGANLNVLSNNNITLGNVDLGTTGRLQVEVDRNNTNVLAQLTAGNLRGASLALLGSASQDDEAVISGTLKSESGDITLGQFSQATLIGDLTSATGLVVSNVSVQLRIGTNVDLLASNGNLNMNLGTGTILLIGTVGTTNTFDARGSMSLSTLNSLNSVQTILLADSHIQLDGSNLSGSLNVTAGNHGALSGHIESTNRLSATSLALSAVNGIGATNELLTSANSISATNRSSGDIRIGNQSASTDVTQLRTESGGNITFRQSDGPARFHRIDSLADGTPTINENRIDLSVAGADLSLVASGLTTNGVGPVTVRTLFTGSINLQTTTQASGSSVLMQAATNIVGTGMVSGQNVRFEAGGELGGPTALRTQTTQLSSQTVLGNTNITNSSAAELQVSDMRSLTGGGISLRQTGGGDAIIGSIVTAAQAASGPPTIALINEAGSITINGVAVAGGQGSISLQAQQDITFTSTSRLATTSETALIEGHAVGRIQFQTGAVIRAGVGTSATEAVVSQLTPLLTTISVVNSQGVNVDSNGLGAIDILLLPSGTGIIDQNYELVIDWGGGEIDRLPLGPLNANTLPTGVSRFDASLSAYRITHQYLQNPNTTDPNADIPVRVTAQVDSLNRIRFTDSQGVAQQLSASSDTVLILPATGLISLYFVLPQTPTIQKQLAFARDNSEVTVAQTVASDRSEPPTSTSTTSSVQQQRKIILRVMSPVDEFGRVEASKDPKDDIPLSPEDLADLDALFDRLSDNRYRIYVILEDGNEVLLKDIMLRNHQPAEIEDTPSLREFDRTQIPSLDDSPNIVPPASTTATPNEANSAVLMKDDRDPQPTVDEPAGMFRSWRKAARRYRSG